MSDDQEPTESSTETNESSTETNESQEEILVDTQVVATKLFTQNFLGSLVLPPDSIYPAHYKPGIHPHWKKYLDCPPQLIDPMNNKQSIGCYVGGHIFIYNEGIYICIFYLSFFSSVLIQF